MALPRIAKAALKVAPIPGPFSKYLNANETAVLIALVRSVAPKVMIEFGCNRGITAKRVLDNVASIERYIGIDVPFGHKPKLSCQDSEVMPNPGTHAADDKRFYLYLCEAVRARDLELCDAAFIDGDHSKSAVRHDSNTARALIRPGGIIVWHDYGNPSVEVTATLDALHAERWPLMHVEGTWLAYAKF